MSKDPAFLFYPNDYIGGTMGMTFEEKGAYIELLMTQFNRGHMTSQVIAQVVGQLWDKIHDKFKTDINGLYYNERLEFEIERRKTFVQSRYNNISGKNQYSKKQKNIKGHKGGHMTNHMENENENENNKSINPASKNDFIIFWDKYHETTKLLKSDKDAAEKYWNKLKATEQQKALENIKLYFDSLPDKKYCKKARTYLADKNFNDEFNGKIVQTGFVNLAQLNEERSRNRY